MIEKLNSGLISSDPSYNVYMSEMEDKINELIDIIEKQGKEINKLKGLTKGNNFISFVDSHVHCNE